jgi:hypothetical protein
MAHVDKCSGCARFWGELKAAQELVLGLPQAKVGSRFRDEVWQRIQSGEGAPDTIAQEPVPVLTKVRYGLLGAAAAAAFILAVHYGVGRSPAIQEREVANTTTDATQPVDTPPPIATPTVTDLTPANLAARTAEQVSLAARSLRNRSKNLTNSSDFQPEVLQAVRRDIETMQNGLVVLRHLRQDYGIEFRDGEARDCETRVLTTLEISPKLERPEEIREALYALTRCSLERLHQKLLYSWESNIPNDERFVQFLRENARRLRALHFVPMPSGQPGAMQFEFLFTVPPPPTAPERRPENTKPRKLRERSPR